MSETKSGYALSKEYVELRNMILRRPTEAGGSDERCVLVEMTSPQAIITLAASSDGAVSLYFSSGGGILGAGEKVGPRAAAQALLLLANASRDLMEPTTLHPSPLPGSARFFLTDVNGVRTAQVGMEVLMQGKHPLAPVFEAAQHVITQIRLATS